MQNKRILVALVENRPGVLNRVASLFRRRNFNIDSLTVGRTETPATSRMTIVVDAGAEQVAKQLLKLVDVISVQDVTEGASVSRDLALIKVQADSETRGEVVQLCNIYRAHIVDTGPETMTVEVTGEEDKIDSMVEMLRPLGILEMVRTGVVAMTRGRQVLSLDAVRPAMGPNGHGKRASVF
jgi:acetolactate synthase-1/3 small subunit